MADDEQGSQQQRRPARDNDESASLGHLAYKGTPYGSSSSDEFKLDDNGGVAGVKSFEDILEIIGTFGKWNIAIFCLCSLSALVTPMQAITYEFLGATPDYWCNVNPLAEANWTQQQIFDLAIPSKDGKEREKCKYFNYNYTKAAQLGYEASMNDLESISIGNGTPIACPSRVFNTTQYKSTIVTEWDLVCESRALYSTTQAASQGGILLGAVVFGYLLDRCGRRPIILLCVVFSLISGLASAVAPAFIFYVIAKTLVSSFNFGFYTGCFVEVMEICSPSQRSSVGSLFVMPWAIGYMVVPGIAYFIREWRWLQAVYSLPVIILFSFYWLLPESPRWLITEGRYEEVIQILSKAAKVNGRALPPSDALLVSLKSMGSPKEDTSGEQASRGILSGLKHVFILLIKSEFRWRALICFFCWISVSMVYYGVSLNSGNLSTDPYLYIFLGGLIEVPSYLILWPMLAYLGRKVSVVTLYLSCALTISIIAVILATLDQVSTGVIMFLSLTGKLAITAAFHLIYVFTAELFPTKYRSLAVGESSMMARIGSISSPYVNDLLGDAVSWGPSALFASVSVAAACLSLLLPETKGTDLTEENVKGNNKEAIGAQENGIRMNQSEVNEAFEPN